MRKDVLSLSFVIGLLCATATAGQIHRSAAEVLAFKRHNPCPSNGQRRGTCPGYAVDHVRALCAGGEDRVSNMQWITDEDHRFKTLVDVRECRKLRRMAARPAQ